MYASSLTVRWDDGIGNTYIYLLVYVFYIFIL